MTRTLIWLVLMLACISADAQIIQTLKLKPDWYIRVDMRAHNYNYYLYVPFEAFRDACKRAKTEHQYSNSSYSQRKNYSIELNIFTVTEYTSSMQFDLEHVVGGYLLLQGKVYVEDEQHKTTTSIRAEQLYPAMANTPPVYIFYDSKTNRKIFEGRVL